MELTHERFLILLKDEWATLDMNFGTPRIEGADQYQKQMILYGRDHLLAIENLLRTEEYTLPGAIRSLTDLAMQISSFLYSAGANHEVWRRWAAITASGLLLTKEYYDAALFATLSGEWSLLTIFSSVALKSEQISDRVLWRLIKDSPLSSEKVDNEMSNLNSNWDVDDAWLDLSQSIPAQEHMVTERALVTLANYCMEESTWGYFSWLEYPAFEVPICAAASLARHNGFISKSLTSEQYRFLEPGLAVPEPSPLFPDYFSLPLLP